MNTGMKQDRPTQVRCGCGAMMQLRANERPVTGRALRGGPASADDAIETRHCPNCNKAIQVERVTASR